MMKWPEYNIYNRLIYVNGLAKQETLDVLAIGENKKYKKAVFARHYFFLSKKNAATARTTNSIAMPIIIYSMGISKDPPLAAVWTLAVGVPVTLALAVGDTGPVF